MRFIVSHRSELSVEAGTAREAELKAASFYQTLSNSNQSLPVLIEGEVAQRSYSVIVDRDWETLDGHLASS